VPLLGRLAYGIAWVTRASIALSAALMLAAITYQVVLRYVFGDTPSWSEELAVLLFSWSVLGGLALGVHEGWHVRLTALPDLLPRGARIWVERATDAVTAALGLFLVWSGWRFFPGWGFRNRKFTTNSAICLRRTPSLMAVWQIPHTRCGFFSIRSTSCIIPRMPPCIRQRREWCWPSDNF